jgi:hypothetical protein
MTQTGIQILPEIPKELIDRLFNVMREKLPSTVDDATIKEINETNLQMVKDYLMSVTK